ncbi:hypothetical protein PM082_004421 [Marasmius tenuissimus]|nr:hypothetical protein PM082_004421 [Marasmius tenuissimus]
MTQLVWLITGTSTGLGRNLAIAALNRGDKVIATARARSLAQIDDLKAKGAETLELDVTASLESLQELAKRAISFYGRVDVLVNNAGYVLVGAIEENTPEETYNQFNTNVFGALNVSRAFLPYMRERKTGTVVFMGSIGGWRAPTNLGVYAATKWALRGISQTLHAEIAPLGLRSICLDFGFFRTPVLSIGNRQPHVGRISDYQDMTEKSEAALRAQDGKQPGDPQRGVQVLVDLMHEEGAAQGKQFPLSIQLGGGCYYAAKGHCETSLANLEEWKDASFDSDFPKDL